MKTVCLGPTSFSRSELSLHHWYYSEQENSLGESNWAPEQNAQYLHGREHLVENNRDHQ